MFWNQRTKKFFSQPEQEQIISAIAEAESKTSGEIRVHLAGWGWGNPMHRAKRTFERLGMTQTAERNGILFFIVPTRKQFAIIGDIGIHKHVHQEFWDHLCNTLSNEFRAGRILEGIQNAITTCGQRLSEYFPYKPDDKNELSNTLSF